MYGRKNSAKDMSHYCLALDLGTTSCRAMIFQADGRIVSSAQQEFTQYFPHPGFVEHDAEEIYQCQLHVAKKALAQSGLSPRSIQGIGITNQRETTVIWDRSTGRPIGRAIVWQDRRTADYCQKMKAHEPLIQAKTGLLLDPYFSATKIRALLAEHSIAIKGKKLAFGTLDSWLIYRLTEGRTHITDMTNASRTLLYNIHDLDWDEDLLKLFDIPRELLPKVRSCSEIYDTTQAFGYEIPICGSAGDQQAALFGQACMDPGMVKCTFGTGAFMLMHTGGTPIKSNHKLLSTIACAIDGKVTYALEGSIFIAGAAVQWLRDNLHFIESSAEIEKLAGAAKESDGVVFVPALTGLGAPYWDPMAHGAILGITRGTSQAQIARALLEGIAFSVNDVLAAMQQDSALAITEVRVDGGAAANNLLMQIQSDILQTPLLRSEIQEVTAAGAAYLAGLAAGIWKSEQEIKDLWKSNRQFIPSTQYDKTQWKRAIQAVRSFHES